MRIDFDQKCSELRELGYCALPAYYSEDECQRMRDEMDGYWASQGSPDLGSKVGGFNIHPMMTKVPAMAQFLDVPEVREIFGRVLEDEVRLVHLGARTSGPQSEARLPWHHHYGWDASRLAGRKRMERILAGVYVDGTQDESGALVVIPRKFDEPLGEPLGEGQEAWPGEVHVKLPPGSIALFDTAIWHSALRGTGNKSRRLWGGHYQGWNDPRPHPEDHEDLCPPEIAEWVAERPGLKSLLVREAVALA